MLTHLLPCSRFDKRLGLANLKIRVKTLLVKKKGLDANGKIIIHQVLALSVEVAMRFIHTSSPNLVLHPNRTNTRNSEHLREATEADKCLSTYQGIHDI